MTHNPADFDRCDDCCDFAYLNDEGLCSDCDSTALTVA